MKRVTVAGGGPAGMMAAIKAAESGAEVTLVEKTDRVGKKMAITGKGRCNITNIADIPGIINNIPGNGKFLNSALRAFDNRAVIRFFEDAGVPTKTERGGRVFPESDRAKDAVDAMLEGMRRLNVLVRLSSPVESVLADDGRARGVRLQSGEVVPSDAVIIATGGASYPATGSTGDGERIAKRLGHKIEPLLPALVPLEAEDEWAKTLSGLSLKNVRAAMFENGKKFAEEFGEMMFTHFGVTGPIILSMSREASRRLSRGGALEMTINLKPALSDEQLRERVRRDLEKHRGKSAKNAVSELLPKNLIAPVLDLAYIDGEKRAGGLTKAERLRLVDTLRRLPLVITGTRPISEAIVTAGGVSTKEIDPKTMESRLVRGLFFAGETVDVDGLTGGYNLQAAFSMGAAAGYWSAR